MKVLGYWRGQLVISKSWMQLDMAIELARGGLMAE